MADHDRDDGSRGEEEAPRDPTPGMSDQEPTRESPHPESPDLSGEPAAASSSSPDDEALHAHPAPDYGPQGPDPAHAYTPPRNGPPPGGPPLGGTLPGGTPPPPRDGSLRDFARQKHTQIFGAALIGLIVGALIGGIGVGVIAGIVNRADRHPVVWQEPGWRKWPDRGYPMCREMPGRVDCHVYPPPGNVYPYPVPTWQIPTPSIIPTKPAVPTPSPTS